MLFRSILQEFVVDASADMQVLQIANHVGRHHRRPAGCESVDRLAARPQLVRQLQITRADVIEGHSAEDVIQRIRGIDVASPAADHDRDLDAQVSDVRDARRQLQEAIRELDDQIMSTFMAAYADVNEHFANLIALLFPGGQGRLLLSVPDDPLNTGVEIEVRPMGRNPRRISLLSGGERSMAAIAFLFAIFRSRPSPFYMMDEVEAALDDVNLQRFIGLVDEFRNEAQLLIVTHQKRTMEAADALYGVTMVPGASSKVVSQRVKRDGTLVAVDTPA